jgi:hypothetical protein
VPISPESELALDHCLDHLLSGEDWSSALPEADRGDVHGLMEVAQKLLTIARQSPHLDGRERAGLWGRVSTPMRGPEKLATELLAACESLFRLLAGAQFQTVEARERARVTDVRR